jgi:multiple sugar transport system substrate-binding protein
MIKEDPSQMKKSNSIILSLLVAISLTAAGCAKSDNKNANPAVSSTVTNAKEQPKAVNLGVFWWGSQPRHDTTNKVLELYKKSNPNITFSPEYSAFDGYYDKLTLLAAANNLPDVFQWYVANDQYFQKNLVEPLDEYVKNNVININDVSESTLASGKLSGKLYGIPLGVNAKGMYADPEAYKKAGLTIPENGYSTWEDLVIDLEKLKAVTGAYGADDIFTTADVLPYYARQYGQTIYSDTGIGLNEETYIKFYTMKKKFIKEGLMPPIDVTMAQKGSEDTQTIKKKAALSFVYSNQFANTVKAAARPLVLIPLPGPNSEKGMDIRPSMHFAISANSKNKAEAAQFINAFINDVESNKILNAERGMPISSKVRSSLNDSMTPEQKQISQYIEKVSQKSSPGDPPAPNNVKQIDELLKDLEQKILFDKISPQDAYKTLKEEAAKIVAKK